MPFVSKISGIFPKNPMFCSILANTMLSTVPGVSGAGPSPEKTLLTPVLDSELIVQGSITSMPARPDTPTGCPTPASITRAMTELTGIHPLFINAGLRHRPTVPCLDVYGEPGNDPRITDAVPGADDLYRKGQYIGRFLGKMSDVLVLGECVPGGTTTALCVLRGLRYHAQVSSSFVNNPVDIKEKIWHDVSERISAGKPENALELVRICGDPMIALAAGIASSYWGNLILAGGTQMLAVAAVIKDLGGTVPPIATTCYVRDDTSANFSRVCDEIGADVTYIDPEFGEIGHSGLARYCIGEVKEGMGAGGAMYLSFLMGFSPEEIRKKIFETVALYS